MRQNNEVGSCIGPEGDMQATEGIHCSAYACRLSYLFMFEFK